MAVHNLTHGALARRAAHAANTGVASGTPRQAAAIVSYSHIQVVPREDTYLEDGVSYHHDDVPTFRSPSLQLTPTVINQVKSSSPLADDPTKTTFAQMARRYNKEIPLEPDEKPPSGPVSLAGLIKLQPSRRKTNRPWRPLELSDFGDDNDNNGEDESERGEETSVSEGFSGQYDSGSVHSRYPTYEQASRATPFDLASLQSTLTMSPASQHTVLATDHPGPNGTSVTLPDDDTSDIVSINTHLGVVDEYTRLFGKQLPDPIHLHTVIGTFDGEIIFIAHPNRDISAHQWSQKSFQWVNIGLYSHTRRRIEGSLAAERLKGSTITHNTIEYFKAAAEQRQTNYKSGLYSDSGRSGTNVIQNLEPQRRPTLADVEHFASLSSASGSTDQLPTLSRIEVNNTDAAEPATPASHTVAGEALEDPFVTPVGASKSTLPKMFGYAQGNDGEGGSMDFGYEFPAKLSAQRSAFSSQPFQVFIQREEERLASMRGGISTQSRPIFAVHDTDFTDNTSSSFEPYARQAILARPSPVSAILEPGSLRPTSTVGGLADSVIHEARQLGNSDLGLLQRLNTNLLNAQGRTVANPHRISSTLNAKAPPYTHTPTPTPDPTGTDNLEPIPAYAQPTTNLKFSIPDSTQQLHALEIASSIAQKAPTPQNFKGPFFTDHMPTTLNPATSLAYQDEEEAKLRDWFYDGQRPARQQEFCKSILAMANVNNKQRNERHLGTIGDTKVQGQYNYENTPLFVALYENLSKYVDESRGGGGQDYFMRAWTKPLPKQQDLGPGGNFSFFDKKRPVSPPVARQFQRNLHPLAPPNWREFR